MNFFNKLSNMLDEADNADPDAIKADLPSFGGAFSSLKGAASSIADKAKTTAMAVGSEISQAVSAEEIKDNEQITPERSPRDPLMGTIPEKRTSSKELPTTPHSGSARSTPKSRSMNLREATNTSPQEVLTPSAMDPLRGTGNGRSESSMPRSEVMTDPLGGRVVKAQTTNEFGSDIIEEDDAAAFGADPFQSTGLGGNRPIIDPLGALGAKAGVTNEVAQAGSIEDNNPFSSNPFGSDLVPEAPTGDPLGALAAKAEVTNEPQGEWGEIDDPFGGNSFQATSSAPEPPIDPLGALAPKCELPDEPEDERGENDGNPFGGNPFGSGSVPASPPIIDPLGAFAAKTETQATNDDDPFGNDPSFGATGSIPESPTIDPLGSFAPKAEVTNEPLDEGGENEDYNPFGSDPFGSGSVPVSPPIIDPLRASGVETQATNDDDPFGNDPSFRTTGSIPEPLADPLGVLAAKAEVTNEPLVEWGENDGNLFGSDPLGSGSVPASPIVDPLGGLGTKDEVTNEPHDEWGETDGNLFGSDPLGAGTTPEPPLDPLGALPAKAEVTNEPKDEWGRDYNPFGGDPFQSTGSGAEPPAIDPLGALGPKAEVTNEPQNEWGQDNAPSSSGDPSGLTGSIPEPPAEQPGESAGSGAATSESRGEWTRVGESHGSDLPSTDPAPESGPERTGEESLDQSPPRRGHSHEHGEKDGWGHDDNDRFPSETDFGFDNEPATDGLRQVVMVQSPHEWTNVKITSGSDSFESVKDPLLEPMGNPFESSDIEGAYQAEFGNLFGTDNQVKGNNTRNTTPFDLDEDPFASTSVAEPPKDPLLGGMMAQPVAESQPMLGADPFRSVDALFDPTHVQLHDEPLVGDQVFNGAVSSSSKKSFVPEGTGLIDGVAFVNDPFDPTEQPLSEQGAAMSRRKSSKASFEEGIASFTPAKISSRVSGSSAGIQDSAKNPHLMDNFVASLQEDLVQRDDDDDDDDDKDKDVVPSVKDNNNEATNNRSPTSSIQNQQQNLTQPIRPSSSLPLEEHDEEKAPSSVPISEGNDESWEKVNHDEEKDLSLPSSDERGQKNAAAEEYDIATLPEENTMETENQPAEHSLENENTPREARVSHLEKRVSTLEIEKAHAVEHYEQASSQLLRLQTQMTSEADIFARDPDAEAFMDESRNQISALKEQLAAAHQDGADNAEQLRKMAEMVGELDAQLYKANEDKQEAMREVGQLSNQLTRFQEAMGEQQQEMFTEKEAMQEEERLRQEAEEKLRIMTQKYGEAMRENSVAMENNQGEMEEQLRIMAEKYEQAMRENTSTMENSQGEMEEQLRIITEKYEQAMRENNSVQQELQNGREMKEQLRIITEKYEQAVRENSDIQQVLQNGGEMEEQLGIITRKYEQAVRENSAALEHVKKGAEDALEKEKARSRALEEELAAARTEQSEIGKTKDSEFAHLGQRADDAERSAEEYRAKLAEMEEDFAQSMEAAKQEIEQMSHLVETMRKEAHKAGELQITVAKLTSEKSQLTTQLDQITGQLGRLQAVIAEKDVDMEKITIIADNAEEANSRLASKMKSLEGQLKSYQSSNKIEEAVDKVRAEMEEELNIHIQAKDEKIQKLQKIIETRKAQDALNSKETENLRVLLETTRTDLFEQKKMEELAIQKHARELEVLRTEHNVAFELAAVSVNQDGRDKEELQRNLRCVETVLQEEIEKLESAIREYSRTISNLQMENEKLQVKQEELYMELTRREEAPAPELGPQTLSPEVSLLEERLRHVRDQLDEVTQLKQIYQSDAQAYSRELAAMQIENRELEVKVDQLSSVKKEEEYGGLVMSAAPVGHMAKVEEEFQLRAREQREEIEYLKTKLDQQSKRIEQVTCEKNALGFELRNKGDDKNVDIESQDLIQKDNRVRLVPLSSSSHVILQSLDEVFLIGTRQLCHTPTIRLVFGIYIMLHHIFSLLVLQFGMG